MFGQPHRLVKPQSTIGVWRQVEDEQLTEGHVRIAVFGGLLEVFFFQTFRIGVGKFPLDFREVSNGAKGDDDVRAAHCDIVPFNRDQSTQRATLKPLVEVMLQVSFNWPRLAVF